MRTMLKKELLVVLAIKDQNLSINQREQHSLGLPEKLIEVLRLKEILSQMRILNSDKENGIQKKYKQTIN